MYPGCDEVKTSGGDSGGPPKVCAGAIGSGSLRREQEPDGTDASEHWFALRTMYCNDMNVARYLKSGGIETFIPMRCMDVVRGTVRKREVIPVVRNLVFVRASWRRINEEKKRLEGKWPVRVFMDRDTRRPLVIPDAEMDNFIRVADRYKEDLVYIDEMTARCKAGDRVRVKSGVFAGVQGKLVRVRGHKRVLVAIEGFMYVATTYIPREMIEVTAAAE